MTKTKSKPATRKAPASVRRKPTKKSKFSFGGVLSSRLALVIFGLLAVGAAVLVFVPDSAPVSLASLTGKNTDRVAPKLDTLSGNYSIAGEAASTSLLVKYKANVSEQSRGLINKQLGATTKRRVGQLGVDVVKVVSTDSVGDTIRKFKARAEVEYVEPNYLAKHFFTPDDSLFSKQWHLHKIDAPTAWDVSQGGYGPIAVIDTGITSSQIDLVGYVTPGYNFVNDSTNTQDDNGHGTHVAGIVSASTNNATGVSSIGYKGTLLPVKVLDATGAGNYGDIASGIVFAVDNGAKIVNMSLGGSSASRTMQDAVNYALSRGVVVVAAAGNNGNNTPVYPAAYPGVVAVTASDQNDNLASFSSYGGHVYISAPGVSIISTYNTGGYATLSGTSMATPVVSGLIGLALAKGTTTSSTVLSDLKSTSDKVGAYGYDANGWNQYFGYGRINAAKLLNVGAVVAPAPVVSEPAPQPTKPGKSQRPTKNAKSTVGTVSPEFESTIDGEVDSVDVQRAVVVLKVKSSSKNVELREGNLVDLYLGAGVIVKAGNSSVPLTSLKSGDSLTAKALWKDNQLNAQEIIFHGQPEKPSRRQ